MNKKMPGFAKKAIFWLENYHGCHTADDFRKHDSLLKYVVSCQRLGVTSSTSYRRVNFHQNHFDIAFCESFVDSLKLKPQLNIY